MARKTSKTPPPDLDKANVVLAQTILEAVRIKEEAGLARNPFTGRACFRLTDEEAARQAAPDESTAELTALILETREEAFIDWARRLLDRHSRQASEDEAGETGPSARKPKRLKE
jgi:hypothetical protein